MPTPKRKLPILIPTVTAPPSPPRPSSAHPVSPGPTLPRLPRPQSPPSPSLSHLPNLDQLWILPTLPTSTTHPPSHKTKMSVPDFSALHCPPLSGTPPPLQKSPLTSWRLEPSPPCTPQTNHPFFNPCTGVYTTPQDGLYSVIIQLIPIGSPQLASHPRLRRSVDYVVKFQEPPDPNTPPDDVVDAEYRDVGTLNFAELIHFKKGTAISCLRMPSGRGIECIRFRVELIQRKRKRPQTPKLSKKQLRKRKMMKHKQTDQPAAASSAASSRLVSPRYYNSSGAETSKTCEPSEDSSDSDWSNGFDSDTSQDELPDSQTVAKRLKSTPAPQLE